MKIYIKDIFINYEVSGVGPPLIFLHGWGSELHTFDKITSQINEDFTVYQIDLPGFGFSEILDSYTISDYANYINEFCLKLNIVNPILVGHSFGGRVAIKFAANYKVSKLILISSPGIKENFNFLKWLKIKIYKFAKKFSLNFNMGSIDYKNSNGHLKNVLVKAINEDLTNDLKIIKTPSLLIYGKKDRVVPIYLGKKIKSLIDNSGIVILNTEHFPYIEKYRHFLIVLKSFLFDDRI